MKGDICWKIITLAFDRDPWKFYLMFLYREMSNLYEKSFRLLLHILWMETIVLTLAVYLYTLLVWVSVCLFVSNKRQNGWTDRAQIFCGTSRAHREGLWMIKILNICLHQNSIFIKFLKILKIHEIFCENPRIIFVLFYNVHKENMFTINLEDGRSSSISFCIIVKKVSVFKKKSWISKFHENRILLDRPCQGTNARKVNCVRLYLLRILCVHIETSSLWAEFVNKNRCITVRLVSEKVKSI